MKGKIMKKTLLLLILLLVAGCSEQMKPTATLLTGGAVDFANEGEEYVGRIGVQVDKTEAGIASQWLQNSEDDQQNYGVYVIQDLISDPNAPLLGNWYLGAQATINFDTEGGVYGPILGTKSYVGGVEILTEFQYRHYNQALSV